MRRRPALFAALAMSLLAREPAAASSFANWAAVVVAGDDQSAHADIPTAAFDNARRDVASALVSRGFSRDRMAQFSLHPGRYPADLAELTDLDPIAERLASMARRGADGCLVYFTSHGAPEGVLVGQDLVPPPVLNRLLRRACGERPTAVILSACFSGVFLPRLASPNRFVLTAARRDRSSFGCSEKDRYPFFDGCVIEALRGSSDFIDLADRVRVCVARREDAEGMRPRSEPQLFVGAAFRARPRPFDPPAG